MLETVIPPTLLVRELHHRVKNSFQLMLSLINLHQVHSDEDALAVLEATTHRLRALAILHEQLFLNRTATEVELNTYLRELVEGVLAASERNIAFCAHQGDEEMRVPIETAVPVGLIVTEVVTNSVKHAFADTNAPAIAMDCTVLQKKLTVYVADNGSGKEKEGELETLGFGTTVVDALSEQLRGSHSWYRPDGGGTAFRIVFPVC